LHILEWALHQGGSLQCVRNDGATPFLQAALHGHLPIVQYLVDLRVDINEGDSSGDTAVMHAAGGGHLDVVKWLVENKADLKLHSKSGSTAVHRATTAGHLEVTKYLLSLPEFEDVNATTTRGCTALHYAARNKHIEIVKWLVEEKSASLSVVDNRGDNLEAIVKKVNDEQLKTWYETWILSLK